MARMVLDPRELLKPATPGADDSVPLAGTRAERLQRLQVGLFGIFAMVLLIALADVVISRAQQTEATAVPEAAPTVEQSETAAPRDPLVDAGVVPDVAASPTPPAEGPAAESQAGEAQPPASNAALQ